MEIKTPRELERMKQAGKVVAHTLKALQAAVVPGITTADLDFVARSEIARHGAIPSFVGYRGSLQPSAYPLTMRLSTASPGNGSSMKETWSVLTSAL